MKTVIYGIGHLKKLYWDNADIIFFDEFGWWIIDTEDKGRKLTSIYDFDIELKGLNKNITRNIVPELIEWMPIWSRWVGRGDQYELLTREAYLQVLYISAGLQKLNIKNAIFQTSVSHHIPTVIFEKACLNSGIKPIFIYLEPITERYVLIQNNNGVADRKILEYKISNFNSEDAIDNFIENKKSKGIPKSHGVILQRYSSLFVGLSYLLIKKNLLRLKQYIFQKIKTKSLRKMFFQLYPFQEYLQMIQQYKAIKFYKNNITDSKRLISKKPKLLVAAHRQPEATSFPEGWGMTNHIDVVIELRRLGYQGDIMYKEHFTSTWYTVPILGTTKVGMYRSVNYFKQLLKLGCKFINFDYKLSLDEDENNWYMPVTITGTIALERSLAGLHTIVMGHPWYKGLPGTIFIDDIESLDSIKEEWLVPNVDIANDAKKFMNNILSYNTLENVYGRKNGQLVKVKTEDLDRFKKEFDSLLLFLNKIIKI